MLRTSLQLPRFVQFFWCFVIFLVAPAANAIVISSPTSGTNVTVGETISFGGDSQGVLCSDFNWDFGGAAANQRIVPAATDLSTTATLNITGTFTITLEAVAGSCETLPPSDSIVITVNPNNAPSASIDNPTTTQNIQTGQSVTFAGTGSDPDGNTPLSYGWDFSDGAASLSVEDPGAVTFNSAGTYLVTFTVTDSLGLSSSDTTTVVVADNIAPNATIDSPSSAITVSSGEAFTLAATGSDPDGNTPLTYSWDIGDGVYSSTIEDPGAVVINAPGTYQIFLSVTDSRGAQSTAQQTVTVTANNGPIATIDTPSERVNIFVGGSVNFSGSGTDPEGNTPLSYSWDFGGGADNVTVEDPGEVFFNQTGTYLVTFTVTDSFGASGSTTQTVVVGDSEGSEVEEALESVAASPNQEEVSGAVVDLCLDAGSDSQLQELCSELATAAIDGETGVADALSQITMDEVSASIDSTMRATDVVNNNMSQRFNTLRSGGSGISVSGLSFNVQGQGVPVGTLLDGYAFQTGGSAGQEIDLGRWGVFANGSILIGDKDKSSKEAGYKFDTKGLTFGVDYRLKPDQVVGVALSLGSMENEMDQNGGKLEGDNYGLILYGTQFTETFYMDTSITYGYSRFDQDRNIRYTLGTTTVDQTLVSDFSGNNLAITIGGGYQLTEGSFSFGPEFRFDYTRFDVDAFEESVVGGGTSGWAMAIDDQTEEVVNTSISAYGDYAASFNWGVLVPSLRLDWIHEFQGDDRVVNGRFVGDSSGAGFSIETDVEDTDYFALSLGASAQLPESKSGFFNYQTLLGKTDIEQHHFTFGVRWDF